MPGTPRSPGGERLETGSCRVRDNVSSCVLGKADAEVGFWRIRGRGLVSARVPRDFPPGVIWWEGKRVEVFSCGVRPRV